jgi:hypothetical protein
MEKTESYLDKVQTTISVSMKTKNDMKKLKEEMSYDEFIRFLMRNNFKKNISNNQNLILKTNFERTDGFYSNEDFNFIFSYNKYVDVPNFRFDIELKTIRKKGKQISFEKYLKERDYFKDYFKILEVVIKNEIDSMFSFSKYGRSDYKDYQSWKNYFKKLGLSQTSYEEDVKEKLDNYVKGENPYV